VNECESIRGKWSTPGRDQNECPDCGGPMPYQYHGLSSDQQIRHTDESRVSNRAEPPKPFSLHRRPRMEFGKGQAA
jgi:hypothetical protein